MIAKYQRQASVKGSVSTPTAAKSFGRQFSRQQSTQAPQPDDEEVWLTGVQFNVSFKKLHVVTFSMALLIKHFCIEITK